MITTKVDISKAEKRQLNLISDAEARELSGKGWSLSFVYSFQEVRDVFLAFKRYGRRGLSVADFSNRYVRDHIPFVRRPWDEKGRRVLEIKNALINFGLMDKDTLACKDGVFEEVEPGAPINESDKLVFRDIFFSYFRFKEFASLFINPEMSSAEKIALTEEQILEKSGVLYYYASKGSRVDEFFYSLPDPTVIYGFPVSEKTGEVKGGFLRFWDLYLSWGSQLGLIERLNMKRQDYMLSDGLAFRACFFVNPTCSVDVEAVLKKHFWRETLVDVSSLVMELCMAYRCSIKEAQQAILNYYQERQDTVSLMRTSEIFIKETEFAKSDRILYPNYKGSYVSHLKLRGYE